jgi:Kef-type K+ transport system membrane component KefB
LLLTLGIILILSPMIRGLGHRFGIPASVGYILLGLLISSVIPIWSSYSPGSDRVFEVLAQLGVVALLFRVGLKSHTSALIEKLPDASFIWIGNIVGSLAVGFVVARYGLQWSMETSLVIATAFSATSVAVSVSVWDELGMLNSEAGQLLVDVAELDDLSAVILLAVLLGALPALMNGDDGLWLKVGASSLAILAKLVLFVIGCYLFAHFIEPGFTRLSSQLSDSRSSLTISILGVGLAIAVIAESLGFTLAIGALFAGLAFSRDPEAVHTDGRFLYFYDLLTPFFFIHIGMQIDLSSLVGNLGVGIVLFLAAAAAKLVSTALPAIVSMDKRDALILAVSMVPRAEIALVVLYACRAVDERIVPPDVFAAMVVVSLGTCIVSPILLRRMLSRA